MTVEPQESTQEDVDQLAEFYRDGWRVATKFVKFCFCKQYHSPVNADNRNTSLAQTGKFAAKHSLLWIPTKNLLENMSTPPPKPPKPQSSIPSENEESTAAAEEQTDIVLKGTKNVAELMSMDTEDESLRKYKESLLGSAARGDLGNTSDPRRLVVEEFRVVFAPEENQPDIVHTLATPEGVAKLSAEGLTMKEGCKFKFLITFRVQHEIIAGIKFVNNVKATLATEKEELVIGSYPPSSEPHKFEFPKWDYNEAPKGMMMRGKYKVSNQFVDSDKVKHLEFEYELNIVK